MKERPFFLRTSIAFPKKWAYNVGENFLFGARKKQGEKGELFVKKWMATVLAGSLLLSAMTPTAWGVSRHFSDVPKDYWAYDAIRSMTAAGLMEGYDYGLFGPDDIITIAQVASVVAKAKGMNGAAGADGYWAYGSLDYCVNALGCLPGQGAYTAENYDIPCTKELAVYMLLTALGVGEGSAFAEIDPADIPDYDQVTPLYQEAVLTAYQYGLLTGEDEDHTFDPREGMTRAQLAAIFARAGWTEPVPDTPEPNSSWNLMLINSTNLLPDGFTAPALTTLNNGQSVDSRVYPALQAMLDDAWAAGCSPVVCSGFRTWSKQERLYQNKVSAYRSRGYSQADAEVAAAFWVARPGTSEHQTGMSVDIVDSSYQQLDTRQENTKTQKWLMAHCQEYGFILRYPTSKSSITKIGYEPWHYRYVGVEAATAIMSQNLCLEEYFGLD
jgi:D-alanyl-D-alanine carboxypeptidase